MTKQLNILLVEDLSSDAELIKLELKKEKINFILKTVDNKKDFLFALKQSKPDIILSDFNLPQFDGLEALEISKEKFHEIPFIFVTGTLNDETVVGCIKAGAWDYVIKEHLVRLGPAVKQALKLKGEIEDKKNAENALRKSEERFRSLIQNSSDIITVIDKSGKVLYHSPSAERILGYKLNEIQKKNYIFELIHTDDIEETKKIFSNILNDFSKIFKIEYRILSKKGNWIYLESFCSNQLNNKSINGIVLNSRDITERKRAEQIQ
ncbi:MAG: PAS domain S-box protein, partial [Bacteroidales bacterium]|nr:PAS domain S-box protein [Bacteroidales bacterium]